MAFSSNSGGGAMCDINVTPLVDVMLVLLIIFMVTAPQLSYPIQVDLPQRTTNPPPPKPPKEPVRLRIDSAGQVYWNNSPQAIATLQQRMKSVVQQDPTNQPTLEIDPDADAAYGVLAKVIAAARNAKMVKIGFVKD